MNTNEQLSSALFNVGRLIKKKMNSYHSANDITQTEGEVLKFLKSKKMSTMKEIAEHLHIKPSSATPVINNLVKKEKLRRIKNKSDRRVIYIQATSQGLKSLQKKYTTIHSTIRKVFEKISEKDKKILVNIFNKINEKNN